MSYYLRPTGMPISDKNKLMLIQVSGANGGKQEAARIAARNRRNFLARKKKRAQRA